MQFSVPQFTEVEDRIIGPLTLKQFLILLAGAAVVFLLFRLIGNLVVFIIASLPIVAVTMFAGFGSYNGKSMGQLILSGLNFVTEPTSYIFHKTSALLRTARAKQKKTVMPATVSPAAAGEQLSRLHRLAYILDQDIKAEETLLKEKYVHLK
ncbi:MAG: PrgI family protein [Candidatus Doudnabacteria bacterium]|nr:PrgI family protein [Candidatus Doudnabacteria bacterium]